MTGPVTGLKLSYGQPWCFCATESSVICDKSYVAYFRQSMANTHETFHPREAGGVGACTLSYVHSPFVNFPDLKDDMRFMSLEIFSGDASRMV